MKTLDAILLGFMVILIVGGVIIFMNIRSKEAQCVVNPLQYGVKVYSTRMGAPLQCTCSSTSPKYLPFLVTQNNTTPLNSGGQGQAFEYTPEEK